MKSYSEVVAEEAHILYSLWQGRASNGILKGIADKYGKTLNDIKQDIDKEFNHLRNNHYKLPH